MFLAIFDWYCQDYLVWGAVLTICTSGFIINLFKHATEETLKVEKDQQTLLLFRVAVLAGLIMSSLLYAFVDLLSFKNEYLIYPACFMVVFGLGLRWWAVQKLAARFTVKVSIIQEHQLEKTGPFLFLRHPSYSALLIYHLGLGLLMQNVLCCLILIILPLIVILIRIKVEEALLLDYFGEEYKTYSSQSWRLLPWIY